MWVPRVPAVPGRSQSSAGRMHFLQNLFFMFVGFMVLPPVYYKNINCFLPKGGFKVLEMRFPRVWKVWYPTISRAEPLHPNVVAYSAPRTRSWTSPLLRRLCSRNLCRRYLHLAFFVAGKLDLRYQEANSIVDPCPADEIIISSLIHK